MSKQSQLAVETPTDTTVRVTRVFDAPRAMVWDCHTKPELLKRWLLGPDGWSMPVCEVDLRVGGKYHYRWRNDADGSEFGFNGVHREIVPQERIVTAERMDGMDDGPPAINTLTLTESGRKTTLTLLMDFGAREARDAAVASGMTGGMERSYQRLDALATAR